MNEQDILSYEEWSEIDLKAYRQFTELLDYVVQSMDRERRLITLQNFETFIRIARSRPQSHLRAVGLLSERDGDTK